MRKKEKILLFLLTFLCCVSFGVYYELSHRIVDQTPPVISFSTEALEVSVETDTSGLLDGVSAWDEQCGDVTASLVVEGIAGFSSNQLATVTYAAFDQAGNVAKAQRTLCYSDYHSPRFTLSEPLIFRSGTAFDVLRYIGAVDDLDGNLSDQIKATLVSEESSVNAEGVHDVEFRVTNSVKDTVYLTIPVEVYPPAMFNATLELSEYLVYLKKGEDFHPNSYLQALRAGTEVIALNSSTENVSVTVDSDVDMAVTGTYSVTYTAKYGRFTGYTRLIVVVEE